MKIILFSMFLSLSAYQGNGQNVNESKMTPNGNAQIFNFPVGTCFYTRNTYYKPIEQQSWTVLEIKKMHVKCYLSDAVGAVKTETLDNGDVYGVTELVSVF
jgi:hypothetical protein